MHYLIGHNIDRIILSSYKAQDIIHFIADHYPRDSRIQCVLNSKALGTGGGDQMASHFVCWSFFALNSDTFFFDIDFEGMKSFAVSRNADLVLAAKRMLKLHRYGTIDIGDKWPNPKFKWKKELDYGWINGCLLDEKISVEWFCDRDVFFWKENFRKPKYRSLRL